MLVNRRMGQIPLVLRSSVVLLSVIISGCSGSNNTGAAYDLIASNGRAKGIGPLSNTISSSKSLVSINSIEISRPVIASTASGGSLSAEEALSIIERVALETMTLKIRKAGGGPSGPGGKESGVDATLHTEIFRFEERKGSAIGGDPALVSFRMALRSKEGHDLWVTHYFLKQEALSDNLLKINQRLGKGGTGAGWNSAHEVFKRGVAGGLKEFNSQRESQFLVGGR